MSEDKDQGEKTEDPSTHRIEEFRKRGEVASSKELTSVLVLSASLLTLVLSTVFVYEELTSFVEWLYSLDVAFAFTEKSLKTISTRALTVGLTCVAPIFFVVLSVGVLSNVAQIGFLFSPEVLQWKLERINPIKGVKKLFSVKSLVEAIKAFMKFIFILSIVTFFIKDEMNSMAGYMQVDFFNSFLHGRLVLAKLVLGMILGLAIIALCDFAYQKISYKKKLMMTKEEAKRENKEQDGNPEIKQRIKQVQRELSQKRMMADIPSADIIITNPTHISIVLKYDQETMVSPLIIGKGADILAFKIREIAKEHNIPIIENVPLARAIYKTVKIGEGVPRNLYKAVAEVLAFVYKVNKKKAKSL